MTSSITVALSERQRSELAAEIARHRTIPPALIGFAVVATAVLVAYALWHATQRPGAPVSPVPYFFGITVYVVVGLVYVLHRFGAAPVIEATYEVTGPGLRVTTPSRSGTIPWSLVARVVDTGSAFLVERYLTSAPIAIAKSALPDGGAAMWHDFDRALTGPGLLVRSGIASNVIRNTRAPEPRRSHKH
jgi:hypothetical protein